MRTLADAYVELHPAHRVRRGRGASGPRARPRSGVAAPSCRCHDRPRLGARHRGARPGSGGAHALDGGHRVAGRAARRVTPRAGARTVGRPRVWLIIVIVVVVVLIGLMLVVYNGLIRQRNQVENAWSQIDVQLKRRDRPDPQPRRDGEGLRRPRARDARRRRAGPQRGDRRAEQRPAAQAQAENQLTGALRQLFALSARPTPTSRPTRTSSPLQEELTATEGRVAYARQFYNDSVLGYNTKIQTFPAVIFARRMKFQTREYFEADDGSREVPKVSSDVRFDTVRLCRSPHVRTDRVRTSGKQRAPDRRLRRRPGPRRRRRRRRSSATAGAAPSSPSSCRGAIAFVSYWKADADRPRGQPRQARPTRSSTGGCYNLVEGLCIAERAAQAAALHRRRPGAERVRHRPQPEPRRHRRHDRPAREDEPRRARGRARPRAVAHQATTTSSCRPWRSRWSAPIALLADIGIRMMWWNGGRVRRDGDRDDGGNPLAIIGFVLLIFAPIIAKADAGGGEPQARDAG